MEASVPFKLGIVGDVMLGRTAGFSKLGVSGVMKAQGAEHVFGDTLTALRNADINLFNMEFVMTDRVDDLHITQSIAAGGASPHKRALKVRCNAINTRGGASFGLRCGGADGGRARGCCCCGGGG